MKLPFARTLLASAAVAAGLMFIAPAQASAQLGFVVQANYGDDVEFGVGGGVRFGLGSLTEKQGIRGEATFDYYFPGGGQEFGTFSSDFDYWEIKNQELLHHHGLLNESLALDEHSLRLNELPLHDDTLRGHKLLGRHKLLRVDRLDELLRDKLLLPAERLPQVRGVGG